jgi:hypothetical protein
MPGLRLAASKGKPKKTAPDGWLGSQQPQEEEDQQHEPDPLFDMANEAPSAAAVRVHALPPVEQSADVAKLMERIAQLEGQNNLTNTGRLMQTPQGTFALTPYQVRFSCESCVKTIT